MSQHMPWVVALGVAAVAFTLRAAAPETGAEEPPVAATQDTAPDQGLEHFTLQVPQVTVEDAEQLRAVVLFEGQALTLELTKHSVRSPRFQVLVQSGPDRGLEAVEALPVATYDGRVPERPEARVVASWRDGVLEALIVDGAERIIVEPVPNGHPAQTGGIYWSYRASDQGATGRSCAVQEDPATRALLERLAKPAGERHASGTTFLLAELGIDADFSFFQENGSNVANTIDDIETIINAVRLDYEVPEINITFEITTLIVRTNVNDPYTSSDAGTLLDQFQNTWNSPPENAIPRDCAQLFTGINLQPPPVGIAQLASGCDESQAYSLVESNGVSGFTNRVALSSHELGHIWGALHCDGCGSCPSCCRIMCSVLGGCNPPTFFGCVEATQISSYASGFGSCLSDQPPAADLPFCEDWASPPIVDPVRWTYNKGAIPSSAASNPPSPPFVIELDAGGAGDYQDDELRSNFVDLSQQIDTVLSYHTQHQGVEVGEELFVEYFAFDKAWVQVNHLVSNGVDETQFVYHEHVLPPQAQHDEFRVRFRTNVNGSSDNWFIDDISLDCFPPPVCDEPCNDGDACTTDDGCIGEFECAGSAVDCSGASDDCNLATCSPIGAEGNCDDVTTTNEDGACSGASGFCSAGACISASTTKRLFMTGDGQQNAAPEGGPTAVIVPAGGTRRIGVFMEDNRPAGASTNGYQVIMFTQATPLSGATGTVTYLDNNPGSGGGNSVVIDTLRNDWVYGNEPVTLTPTYNETPAQGYFGVQYTTIPGTGVDTAGDGVLYLAEFDVQASANASGQFQLEFKLDAAPLTSLFNPFGAPLPLDQPQALLITIGDVDCLNASDCGDLDSNGVRDDPCLFYACAGGACQTLNRDAGQADMGGFAGTCQIDGACDINDKFHAQNCFGNQDTDASPGYPCEQENPDYPPNALNVDAVGFAGTCVLDGVCDINDAFASENCFANVGTQGSAPFPCSCNGPLPQAPQQAVRPQALSKTGLTLRGPRSARPGTLIDIDVYADQALKALRGYQLHLAATGGAATGGGSLELVDITVDDQRRGYVFGDADQPAWMTFNTATRQMLAGVSPEGVSTPASGYLATFTYRVPDDADGTFVIDVLHDELNPRPTGRTFLFATPYEPIGIDGVRPAIVQVHGARTRAAR